MLVLNGYDVIHAKDGTEAVELAAESDAILMDYEMPRTSQDHHVRDGLHATRILRAEHYPHPIILYTATNIDDLAEPAESAGCTTVIQKPQNAADLVYLINMYLGFIPDSE